jgi:hypothetical protein
MVNLHIQAVMIADLSTEPMLQLDILVGPSKPL